jgi:tetratricopeptide (TPR) repeat protein
VALAREYARRAQEADPMRPLRAFIDARVLYDEDRYAEALPLFQAAVSDVGRPGGEQIGELHFYTADTLGRLERYPEAEAEFLEELKLYPYNSRARAGLAMLYEASGRLDAAGHVLDDILRVTPTPEIYALVARLWAMFGNRQRADAVRAEARSAFADTPRPQHNVTRH